MKYRALVNFTGLLSMRRNEVREIANKELIKDLLSANYIEEVEEEPKEVEEEPKEEKPVKTKSKKLS